MQADIAVLTVIPEELKWAQKAFQIREKDRHKVKTGTIYWHSSVRSHIAKCRYSIVLTCIGYPGNYACAIATSDVINEYGPKVVLLMGIAAGLRGKIKIGEVVLSERVVAYEPAAIEIGQDGTEQIIPRPDMPRIEHTMEQDVANYMGRLRLDLVERKFRAIKGTYPAPSQGMEVEYQKHVATEAKIKSATIASGEKLLRHPDKLYRLHRDLHGRIEVGEMEAAGLADACKTHSVPWLVVRGISDFGDQFKDDRFHEFAAKMAAVATHHFTAYGLELGTQSHEHLSKEDLSKLPVDQLFQIRPVQSQGENIYYNQEIDGVDHFFVQVHFELWSKYQLDISNVDLQYGSRDLPLQQTVVFDGKPEPTDASYRLQRRVRLNAGSVLNVVIRRQFTSRKWSEDYGVVKVAFELSSPELGGFRKLEITGRLAPGGRLHEVKLTWAKPSNT